MESSTSRVSYRQLFDSNSRTRWSHKTLLKQQSIAQGKLQIIYDRVKSLSIADGVVSSIQLSTRGELPVSKEDEVLLCAGTFGTPQLLYDSGIKSVHESSAVGKRVDVGENLQDHSLIGTMYFGPWAGSWNPFDQKKRITDRAPANCVHDFLYLDEDGVPLKVRSDDKIASCQLLFMDGRIAPGLVDNLVPNIPESKIYNQMLRPVVLALLSFVLGLSFVQWFLQFIYAINVCCMQPHSRGRLIFSDNTMKIDCQIGSDPRDRQLMLNGLKTVQNLVSRLPLSFLSFEVLPGPFFTWCGSQKSFQQYFSVLGTTYFHPCGTCSMDHIDEEGDNVEGVVDGRLRVKGFVNLLIADASVIPHIPNFAIAKVVMLIGLRAADIIREDREQK